MDVRRLVLLLLFPLGGARRILRVDDAHHGAQQQNNTPATAPVEVSRRGRSSPGYATSALRTPRARPLQNMQLSGAGGTFEVPALRSFDGELKDLASFYGMDDMDGNLSRLGDMVGLEFDPRSVDQPRSSWIVRKLRGLRRKWREGKYRVGPPNVFEAAKRASKTAAVAAAGYVATQTPWLKNSRDIVLPVWRTTKEVAKHVGQSVISGEFRNQVGVLAQQFAQLGGQYSQQLAAVTLAVGVVKALPLVFPEWYAENEKKNAGLRAAIISLLQIPRWVVVKLLPGIVENVARSARWIVLSAVQVLRDTPEGVWGVATDLLWLIDGVLLEGLIEYAIPETERLLIRAVTDVMIPLMKFAGRQVAASPRHVASFLRLCGSILRRVAMWTTKLPRRVWRSVAKAFTDYFIPFVDFVGKEITLHPTSNSRHFFTVSLPHYLKEVNSVVSAFLQMMWRDVLQPAPRRALTLLRASAELVSWSITEGSRTLLQGIWMGLQGIRDAVEATPGILSMIGSGVTTLIHWVFTEGIQLLWHGVVTTAIEGVPMLIGACLNVVIGLLEVMAAVASAMLQVLVTAAEAVISLV